jgi:proteasome lid subunit RPN8/RPN11
MLSGGGNSLWSLGGQTLNELIGHATASYPNEACGILLADPQNPKHILEIYPTKNVTTENPRNRYVVDPLEFLDADRQAEEQGLEICGFYHSHPNYPPTPSEYDRKLAQEGYLYLILSIRDGAFDQARAWMYRPEEKHFEEVGLEPSSSVSGPEA